jgi:small subunit ribosomal protein S8
MLDQQGECNAEVQHAQTEPVSALWASAWVHQKIPSVSALFPGVGIHGDAARRDQGQLVGEERTMSMSDSIGDMLTRIRNGQASGQPLVAIPHSKIKLEICRILKREGYLNDYSVEGGVKKTIRAFLKYDRAQRPLIRGVRRVSRPGYRRYVELDRVPKVLGGMGVAILTTPAGILTGKEAVEKKVGGELICTVW